MTLRIAVLFTRYHIPAHHNNIILSYIMLSIRYRVEPDYKSTLIAIMLSE